MRYLARRIESRAVRLVIAGSLMLAAAVWTGAVLAASDTSSASAKEGVSRITIIPSRVYEDQPSFTVRVTTTAPARPGRFYGIQWLSTRREDCTWLGGSDARIKGGVNKTYSVKFRPMAYMGDTFCVGPAVVEVISWKPRTSKIAPVIKRLDFRIYRTP